MSVTEWAAVSGAILGIVAAAYSVIRVMMKSLMTEFKPNGGSSLKDQVNRIEKRLDTLYEILIED